MSLIKCYECGKEISDKAISCVHCGAPGKIKKGKPGVIGCLLFILVLVVIYIFISHSKKEYFSDHRLSSPEYEIVEYEPYDAPVKTQIVVSAVVSGEVTEKKLKNLLTKLYNDNKDKAGFKYHGGTVMNIFIYLYPSMAHYESGRGFWIAMLERIGKNGEVNIRVRTKALELSKIKKTKFGLSEESRMNIYINIYKKEHRAMEESKSLHPLPDISDPNYQVNVSDQVMKRSQTFSELNDKYKIELANKFNITSEELVEIAVEGLEKNRPH